MAAAEAAAIAIAVAAVAVATRDIAPVASVGAPGFVRREAVRTPVIEKESPAAEDRRLEDVCALRPADPPSSSGYPLPAGAAAARLHRAI